MRQHYLEDYPPAQAASGSLLLTYAHLAQYSPPLCDWYFYRVDWADEGDTREATAYGANVLARRENFGEPCLLRLSVTVPRATHVDQWDGEVYHPGVRWAPDGPATRYIAYEPRWPFPYEEGAALFQFTEAFVEGEGLRVAEGVAPAAPAIIGEPPPARVGEAWRWLPVGQGEPPFWWSAPAVASLWHVDHSTGEVSFTPGAPGEVSLTLRLTTESGVAERVIAVAVAGEHDAASPPLPTDAATPLPPDAAAPPPADARPAADASAASSDDRPRRIDGGGPAPPPPTADATDTPPTGDAAPGASAPDGDTPPAVDASTAGADLSIREPPSQFRATGCVQTRPPSARSVVPLFAATLAVLAAPRPRRRRR